MKPASIFKRFIAHVIDRIILLTSSMFLTILMAVPLVIVDAVKLTKIIYFLIFIVLAVLYYAFFESSRSQATPGKRLLKLYVSGMGNQKLSTDRAFCRLCLQQLPVIFTCLFAMIAVEYTSQDNYGLIGLIIWIAITLWYIPIFFTKDKKTVYDMLSSSRVNAKQS